MTTALLSSTYFGPIQWYQKLCRYDRCLIERHDSYAKQTYRNRCLIATTNGVQALTVPIVHSSQFTVHSSQCIVHSSEFRAQRSELDAPNYELCTMNYELISDHGNWRRLHWQALQSAYGDSPFFEYYEDDLRPFFTERWELLYDFNEAIRRKMCELLDIHPSVAFTTEYMKKPEDPAALHDFREAIRPKRPAPDPDFRPRPYYQVYREKHGFLPNLSILDLLLNMGPESIFYLAKTD